MFWNLEEQLAKPGECLPHKTQHLFFNIYGICNIVQDTSIFLLPIPMLWNLQIPFRQKLAVCTLLCVGLFAVAGMFSELHRTYENTADVIELASCIRLYYVLLLGQEDQEVFYYIADSLNWSSIEIYAGKQFLLPGNWRVQHTNIVI